MLRPDEISSWVTSKRIGSQGLLRFTAVLAQEMTDARISKESKREDSFSAWIGVFSLKEWRVSHVSQRLSQEGSTVVA